MTSIRVQVSGITNLRDALEAVHLGAHALAFDFRRDSPSQTDPAVARAMVERLPVLVERVGVFSDQRPKTVSAVARAVGLSAVQLHGAEDPEACAALDPLVWFKAFHAGPGFLPEQLSRYRCGTYLVEIPPPGHSAQAGEEFPLERLRHLSLYGRIILAGPFGPEDVEEVLVTAVPYGVEAGSGVAFAPGHMDVDRLEGFMQAVRRAEARLASARDGRAAPRPKGSRRSP